MSKKKQPETKAVIGRTVDESTPHWYTPVRAKEGAPNILIVVWDDVGFGQTRPYGGLINTPTLDRLAKNGLLFNNFHTTALCSPTRSCILTGRNHHSNHMAGITEISTGYPGYDGRIPHENGFLSEMLLEHGYSTFGIGKWHLTPTEETNMAATKIRWPLGRGFERFYGFLGGETDQYYPDLVYDNHPVVPPTTPEEGYHVTDDLTDKAIQFIKDLKSIAPTKPFFMYYSTGACHAPHHVHKKWIDKYKGKFDMGWEKTRELIHKRQLEMGIIPLGTKLPAHDPDVLKWDEASDDEKRLYARMMEVYAGFMEHTDYNLGRLLDFIEEIGELENTLIIGVFGDNGASAEGGPSGSVNENFFFNNIPDDLKRNLEMIDELGGPMTYNHYPWGWTWAGDTPFRRWKRETYRGGAADPFIIHWPKGIKAKGEIRSQFVHAIDIVPTVLELLNIESPKFIKGVTQSEIEGTSFAYCLEDKDAPERHHTQYFEMLGHRAIYHNGWRAVCPWPGPSFAEAGIGFGQPIYKDDLEKLEADGWELYHIAEDFSETTNLAKKYPEKLREMVQRWWTEAGKYNVLPIDGRGQIRLAEPRPQIVEDRSQYIYYPGAASIDESVAAPVKNRNHTITAKVEIPDDGAEGVLLAHGGRFGGYSLYLKDNRLHYCHNFVGIERYTIYSDTEIKPGKRQLSFKFEVTSKPDLAKGKGAGGVGRLYQDNKQIGEGKIPNTAPISYALAGEGLCCGFDEGEPVTEDYKEPFEFTGKIKHVIIDIEPLDPKVKKDHDEAKAKIAMTVQ